MQFNKSLKKLITAGTVCLLLSGMTSALADSATDLQKFHSFFKKQFPTIKTLQGFADGVYAFDRVSRDSWVEIEEFPPYEIHIDSGKEMWDKTFKNGKSYKSCFPAGPAIGNRYPYWDKKTSKVVTLPVALNHCLTSNGEKKLKYKKGPINNILSYIAFKSRGQVINTKVPKNDPKAVAAYSAGKQFWLARRGQLNMSCATCHAQNAGQKIRADVLSPALGHVTHFPVYRSKWGTVGTLHRRFSGCNKQVRAKSFKAQGDEYRNLEYFLTVMSNGMKLNGPGARK